MSCVPVATAAEVCANCGKGGSDAVRLKNCTACYLVKYCSVDCQKIHRKLHKKACKERAAELKDEELYSQGHERPEGDFCPLCLLAIPFPQHDHALLRPCCSKLVCKGCCLMTRKNQVMDNACPFCRTPEAKNVDVEALGRLQKRVAARDPEAICYLGDLYCDGECGLEKDESRASELWTEAAELGSIRALEKIGALYYCSEGVALDEAKGIHYWELAAMRGCAESRNMLGLVELGNEKYDRALRHFLISAKMGLKDSLDAIKDLFTNGHATKAQYVEGLKGYQGAVEEMKSHERDEAVAFGY